jgi:transcriptional regulator with XRE-family HTH domain
LEDLEILCERLKQLREEKDVSLEEVARVTGISKSLMSRYERGLVEPGLKALSKLVKYYNVSLDWLFGFTDKRDPIDITNNPFLGLTDNKKNEALSFIQFLKNKE